VDIKLAAELVSGRIDRNSTQYCLMRLLQNKHEAQRLGRRRKTASRLPGVSDELMAETGFMLAQTVGDKSGMSQFGYNPRGAPSLNLSPSHLPNFFTSHVLQHALNKSAMKCLGAAKCRGNRRACLLWDDTNFIPGFDLLHGLTPPIPLAQPVGAGCIVGGAFDSDPEKNYAILSSNPMPSLDYSKLAALSCSFLVKNCCSDKQTWDMCMNPRLRKGWTKQGMLCQVGEMMQALTISNNLLPPLSACGDWHPTHVFIWLAFLGLMHRLEMRGIPFFQDCVVKLITCIPFYVYGILLYRDHPVYGSGDGAHLQKHWVDKLRSGIRWVMFGGCSCLMVSSVSGWPKESQREGRDICNILQELLQVISSHCKSFQNISSHSQIFQNTPSSQLFF